MAINYQMDVVNPLTAAVQGLQLGQGIRQQQQQSLLIQAQQAEALAKQRQVEQEMAKAQRTQQIMDTLVQLEAQGKATSKDYNAALAAIGGPDILKERGQALTREEELAGIRTLAPIMYAFRTGNTAIGQRLLEEGKQAALNSGDVDQANSFDSYLKLLTIDPKDGPALISAAIGTGLVGISPEAGKAAIDLLPTAARAPTAQIQEAQAYAETFGQPGTPEYVSAFREALVRPQGPAVNVYAGAQALSPGQEAMDKKFADVAIEWTTGGGANTASQIATLNDALKTLSSGQRVSGPIVGLTPGFIQAWINPQARALEQDVQSVVIAGLRQALGAQFTEKEGTRLLNLAFDPSLPPAENKKRVQRLFAATQAALDAKEAAVTYFEENGTLKGYRYRAPSVADFQAAIQGRGPLAAQTQRPRQDFSAMNSQELLTLDPQRLNAEELRAYLTEMDRRGLR